MKITVKRLSKICLLGLLYLLPVSLLSPIFAEGTLVDTVPGKEGKRFVYKDLYRKGDNYYLHMLQKGQQLLESRKDVSSNATPQLLPKFSQREEILEGVKEYGANDFVELRFQMEDLPASATTLHMLNRLLQMETMTGIEYFSGRAQKMTTYIKNCYVVPSVSSKEKMTAPQFSSLPKEPVDLVIMQDDNRFAPTWYHVRVQITSEGGIRLSMRNMTPIYVQFIFNFKALEVDRVRHEILILPNGDEENPDHPIVYALSQVHNDRKKVLGIELNLGNSFDHRMSGIQSWISERIFF